MPPISPLPTYDILGFNQYMEKPLNLPGQIEGVVSIPQNRNINYDQQQVSGSLGDKIQIGSITIDGVKGRILVNDGNVDRIIIGEME